MIIREAKDQDTDKISDLIFDIWMNEYHFDIKTEEYPDLNYIDKYYTHSGGLFLIAVVQDEIIGTIACEKLDYQNYVLKRMFVNKANRGLGVAQSLLDELFHRIVFSRKQYDLSFILSTKNDQAIAAKKFYLKNKFHIISPLELPDKFPYFYQDDLFMKRNVWI